jgi:hypothetical protein
MNTQEMIKRLFLSIAISVAALIAGTSSVTAAVTRCDDLLLPGTYDAVLVPKGKECSVVGDVTVEGNVILQEGASLIVQGSGFTVNGNLQGNSVSKVTIQRSPTGPTITIHGNVSITGATQEVSLFEVSIGGNLKISNSNGGPIIVLNSQVAGNALLQNNTTDTAFGIIGNTIVGNLVCNGNDPAPVVMNSTVSGQTIGQCKLP